MEKLIIESSETGPFILFDKQNNTFKIEGKSVLEDSELFFEPALNWLDNYCQWPNALTHFEFNMECFNISSSKSILSILYKLNELNKLGHQVKVTWYYSEDEMYESGEDFAFLLKIPFELKEDSSKKNNTPVLSYVLNKSK